MMCSCVLSSSLSTLLMFLTTYSLGIHCTCIHRGGDSYQKVGGGGRNFATSTIATSPGLPLLFLEYIMQKGKKNEERNLNAWDRSFEKLDMPHT